MTAARSTIVFVALVLTACAARDVYEDSRAGYVAEAPAIVADVDWTTARQANVVLSEYAFAPADLTFHHGTPYRLHIENRGSATHTFVSEEFFKAIAVGRLASAEGDIRQPYLRAIAVGPGEAKDLYFVPVETGEYALECTRPLHAAFGMTGTIAID